MIRRQRDYPKTLIIGENSWDIIFVRKIPGEDESTLGLCNATECTIYIKMGQSPEERFKSLIHELMHAIAYTYNIKQDHNVIWKLETPILKLLLDNGIVL